MGASTPRQPSMRSASIRAPGMAPTMRWTRGQASLSGLTPVQACPTTSGEGRTPPVPLSQATCCWCKLKGRCWWLSRSQQGESAGSGRCPKADCRMALRRMPRELYTPPASQMPIPALVARSCLHLMPQQAGNSQGISTGEVSPLLRLRESAFTLPRQEAPGLPVSIQRSLPSQAWFGVTS